MATVELTKENFNDIVGNNDVVIIDFWAEWCGPCKRFAPVFEAASEKYDNVIFGKVNTEEQPELSQYFQIRSIPTLVVFRGGREVARQSGAMDLGSLQRFIEGHLQ